MMDWTDRHDRFFLRLISRRALLYSEMITTGAVIHGDQTRFLAFHPAEHPVALQLGGSDPADLARAAAAGEAFGYDEINLNVGCPSGRVQKGRFGACLMAEPALVAACVSAMRNAVGVPVTVKSRIGIDDRDSYADLAHFVETVATAGCRTFIVHARKAWLKGLSPKQNREIPPLEYSRVHRLKLDFPELELVLNGGIGDLEVAASHLRHVDGVMMGRAAYQDPYILSDVDRRFFGGDGLPPSREAVARAFAPYVAWRMEQGVPLKSMTRHILGLFNGRPGAKNWRRALSTASHRPGAGPEVIEEALAARESVQARRAA